MAYVSAVYGPPDLLPMPEGTPRVVYATDDQGVVHTFREDSEVGDWLRYREQGGTIDPAPEAPQPEPTPPTPKVQQASTEPTLAEPAPSVTPSPTDLPRAEPDITQDGSEPRLD